MSTTIDNKIVEMSFNNSDFEKNAQQTIETTEKLKSSLNFESAGKGLEQLGSAAKSCDIGVLATAAEAVSDKFDTMKYLGIMALQDIYNAATRTAAQLVNTFAIQPVSSGFAEYELKMGSIQTIMASTSASLEEVNSYLDELNTYADKTIYSFADMTNNIGKFTNAGVSLDQAVAAIQGISNEAAVSGANTNEASRAMYNFAQALSAGYVKLIDWKSIENANMATVEFKNELISTAVELGNLEAQADGTYKVLTSSSTGSTMSDAISATQNFNDSLQYQWMTTDVLTQTLAKYSDETTEIGKKAFAAATEVKTFSMMMDTLEEAAGSGWTETWEILVGDFEQAKKFWTKLTDYFDDIIGDMSDARNTLLEDTLGSGFDLIENSFESTFEDAGKTAEDFENKIKELGDSSGLAMDTIIEEAGSMGAAFESGALSTDLITQAISEMATTEGISESKTKSLTDAASDMFDNFHEKSGRTLLQESLYNTLDSIKMVIETITNTWDKLDDTFTSSKIYSVIQNINQATTDFKSYISDNLADPWNDVETAISDAGMDMDTFQSKLADTGRKSNIDVDALVKEYGSLQACFEAGVLTGDLVLEMFEDMNSSSESTASTVSEGTETVSNAVEDATETLQYYQKVVDEVWNGDWSKQQDRYDKLAAAGYDYVKVQDLVNRTVDGHRITLEDLNAVGVITTETTQEEAEALVELANSAKESGSSINEALNKLGKKTGLQLAVQALHDLFESLKVVVNSFKSALTEAFDTSIVSTFGDKAYSAITWIQNKTETFSNYMTSHASQLTRTFKGVFKVVQSLFKDVSSVVTGLIKIVAKLFDHFTGATPDILELTGNVGDFFSALADGIDVSEDIDSFFDNITEKLPNIVQIIEDVIAALKEMPVIGDIISSGENIWSGISGPLFTEIDKIKSGETSIHDAIVGVATTVVNAIAEAVSYVKENGFGAVQQALSSGKTGVVGTLKSVATGIKGPATQISEDVSNFLTKLGQAAITIAPIVGSFVILKNISTVISSFATSIQALAEPLKGFQDLLAAGTGVLKQVKTSLSDLTKSLTLAIKTEAMINLAIAVGIIAGIIVVLAQLVKSDLNSALIACGMVTGIIIALTVAMAVANSVDSSKANAFMALGAAALMMAAGIGIICLAIKSIGEMDTGSVIQGCVVVGLIIAAFVAVVLLMNKKGIEIGKNSDSLKNYSEIGKLMLSAAASLLIVAVAIRMIASTDSDGFSKALAVMTVFYGFMTALVVIAAFISSKVSITTQFATTMQAIGTAVKSIGTAFLLCAAGIYILGSMSQSQINKGVEAMYAMLGFFSVMTLVSGVATRLGGMGINSLSKTLLSMSGCILIMAGVSIILSKCDASAIHKGEGFIIEFAAIATGMYAAIGIVNNLFGGGKAVKATAALLSMSISIGILAAIAVLLGYCDASRTQQGIGFVAQLAVLASMMAVASSTIKTSVIGNLTAMAACVAVLAVIAVAFTLLDPTSLQTAVGALSLLMVCFSLMVGSTALLKDTKGYISKMIGMVSIVAVLAVIIALLCNFGGDLSQALTAAEAIGVLMLSLSASLVIAQFAGDGCEGAISSMTSLAVVMGVVGLVLVAILKFADGTNLSEAITMAVAIGGLLAELAVITVLLSKFGNVTINTSVIATMGVLAGVLAVIGIVIGTLTGAIAGNVEAAVVATATVAVLLLELTAVAMALSTIQVFNWKAAAQAVVVALAALIGVFGTLEVIIIAANNINGDTETFRDDLVNVATALGNGIGALIQGIGGAIVNVLTSLIQGFASGMMQLAFALTLIGPEDVANAAILCQVMTILSAATFPQALIGQIVEMFTGEAPIEASLRQLGEGLAAFANATSGINTEGLAEKVNLLPTLAAALTQVQSCSNGASLMDLLCTVFGGGNTQSTSLTDTMTDFGNGLSAFATAVEGVKIEGLAEKTEAIKTIAEAMSSLNGVTIPDSLTSEDGGFNVAAGKMGRATSAFSKAVEGVNSEAVTNGTTALSSIINTLSQMPTEGGWISNLTGSVNYDGFASSVGSLGEATVNFANKFGEGFSADACTQGTEALKSIIEVMSEVPDSGGILQAVLGGKDYSGFATSLGQLSTAVCDYALKTSGLSTEEISEPTEAMKYLFQAFDEMPTERGFFSGLVDGSMDMNSFSQKLPQLAQALTNYSNQAKNVDVGKVNSCTGCIKNIINQLRAVQSAGLTESDVTGFANCIKALKEIDLSGLASTFSEENTSNINLSSFVTSLKTSLTSSIQNADFTDVMTGLAGKISAGLSNAMSTDTNGYGDIGSNIINTINTSLTTNLPLLATTATTVGTTLVTNLTTALSSVDFTTILSSITIQFTNFGITLQANGTAAMAMFGVGLMAGASTVSGSINSFMSSIVSSVNSAAVQLTAAGLAAMTMYSAGFIAGSGTAITSASTVMASVSATITAYSTRFTAYGLQLSVRFAAGITSGVTVARVAAAAVMSAACAEISKQTSVFNNAGYNAALGFAEGINSGSYKATIAARAMANAAATAAQKALDEHSPSKVFKGIGDFAAQGLAIGMTDRTSMVENAGSDIATALITGYNSASSDLMGLNSSIIPTIDYAALRSNTGKLDFSATMNRLIADPVKTSADRMAETQARFEASNQKIVDGLSAVQNDLSAYTTAVANSETAMYVDGNKLASSIVKPMNKQLGILSKRNR